MSYARFSSDDFRSDVYVYESEEGFIIHVASKRANITDAQYATLPPDPAGLLTDEDIRAFLRRNQALSQLLEDAGHTPIDHDLAGETFVLETPGDTADRLEELLKEGFVVPPGTMTALQEEQKELDSTF